MRDRLFALLQLALLAHPGALFVAGPDWQACGRGLPIRLREGVSFRRLLTYRGLGSGQQWAMGGEALSRAMENCPLSATRNCPLLG
jgi:hypothetical protein